MKENDHLEKRSERRQRFKKSAWTLSRLWDEYEQGRPGNKSLKTDNGRFEKHIKPALGDKGPHEIILLDVQRLTRNLSKNLKPQTVRHVLGILKRIILYGVKHQYCSPLPFPIDSVRVDNQTTEDLSPDQLTALLKAIDESANIQAANMMRMALFTGMRRGELFRLRWNDAIYSSL